MIKRIFSILTVITLLISCRNTPTEKHTSPEKGVVATHAMVVSAKEEASQIAVSYTQQTLPTKEVSCRSRTSP